MKFLFSFFTREIVNLEARTPEEFFTGEVYITVSIIPNLNISLANASRLLRVIFPDKEIVSAEFQMEIFKNLYILREQ